MNPFGKNVVFPKSHATLLSLPSRAVKAISKANCSRGQLTGRFAAETVGLDVGFCMNLYF